MRRFDCGIRIVVQRADFGDLESIHEASQPVPSPHTSSAPAVAGFILSTGINMKFHCTFCGQGVETASHSSGGMATCPGCDAQIPVPDFPEGLPAGPPPVPTIESPSRKSDTSLAAKFHKVFLYGLLGFFVICAATAISSLLFTEVGEVRIKILLTTLALSVYSLTGLCCSVLVDRGRLRAFGLAGIAISIAGALFATLTNWEIIRGADGIITGRFSILIVAVSFSQAALLLMMRTSNHAVRTVRKATLCMIAIVAVMLLWITSAPGSFFYLWVVLGVFGILDVLGTIATPILHLANRTSRLDQQTG